VAAGAVSWVSLWSPLCHLCCCALRVGKCLCVAAAALEHRVTQQALHGIYHSKQATAYTIMPALLRACLPLSPAAYCPAHLTGVTDQWTNLSAGSVLSILLCSSCLAPTWLAHQPVNGCHQVPLL
jgi:hypothetical protein